MLTASRHECTINQCNQHKFADIRYFGDWQMCCGAFGAVPSQSPSIVASWFDFWSAKAMCGALLDKVELRWCRCHRSTQSHRVSKWSSQESSPKIAVVVVPGGRSYMVLNGSTISTQFQHLRSSAGAVHVGHPYGTSGEDSSCTS